MLSNKSSRYFLFFTASLAFLFLNFSSSIFSQETEIKDAVFILKGNTKLMNGKSAEGVSMELKMNGQTITKIISGKNGKYYLQMDVSTVNPKNEYLLYISQPGTVPKTLNINSYIPPNEFNDYSVQRYDFDLEIKMLETTVRDIILERPSGKIHWDSQQHEFTFDQEYAKIIQKEEQKLEADPDKYLKDLALQKGKMKARADSIKAAQETKHKAQEDSARLAQQKVKEAADLILQKNLEAAKGLRKKRMKDSLDSLSTLPVKPIEIKEEVSAENVDQNAFDGTGAYSINIAKQSLKASKEKQNKEKAANLSAKYETNNTLTSLLDMVDENDKNQKLKSR
jgi:hypothetical protein